MPDQSSLSARTAVIADDHALIREGLRRLLDRLDVMVLEEVANGLDAIRAAKTHRPDLFILDLAMPYAKGVEVFVEIRRQSPSSRIAVLTGLSSSGLLSELMAASVDGLFLKQGSADALAQGLNLVLQGGKFVSAEVMHHLEKRPPPPNLTLRERQTLSLVAQGYTNAEIGERLHISPKTVDNHRTNLMSKLGVHSMSELLAHALREGLLDSSRQL